jgi:hypothetical protein
MKRIILACLVLAALLSSSCLPCSDCGSAFYEGRNSLRGEIDQAYSKGYNQALKDLNAQCCDICITYPERQVILDFLETDDTDTLPYGTNCIDYCDQLIERAWIKGIPVYLVVLDFVGLNRQHTIVVFPICEDGNIIDRFVEPQTDSETDIAVGNTYPICLPGEDFCRLYKISNVRIIK